MGNSPKMSEITLGDKEKTQTAKIHDIDGLKTANVQSGGNVYIGREYEGREVVLAYRFEDDGEQKTDDSDTEDSEN